MLTSKLGPGSSSILWIPLCGLIASSGLARNQHELQALFAGARSNQLAAVRSVIESGRAPVDAQSKDGWTALLHAAHAGHPAMVRLLLDKGADVTPRNERGETALILASQMGWTDVVRELVAAGAKVDVADEAERTAWSWAAWAENEQVLEILRQASADASGRRPFDDEHPKERPVLYFQESPQLKKGKLPRYPKSLVEERVQGSVVLRMVVGLDGRSSDVELLDGLDESLDAEVLKEARKWRFEPGTIQGKPVAGYLTAELEYNPLQKEPNFWSRTPRLRN